mgnify:CR=1 FL=1
MENKSKNPFLQNNKLAVIEIQETYYESRTSNIDSDGFTPKFKKVTETHFIEQQPKVYLYKIPFALSVYYKHIKSHGRDIFFYIALSIKENTDFIEINPMKLSSELCISKSAIYNGIQQLIDVSILCKKAKSEYWVNPTFLFRGNRLSFYQNNCADCTEVVAVVHKDANGNKSAIKHKKNNKDAGEIKS